MKARRPSSPHVSLAPRPDAREAILTRRTFRTFERHPVPSPLRVDVLEAARWALSVGGAESVREIVIDDPTLKKELFRLTRESKDISNQDRGRAGRAEHGAHGAGPRFLDDLGDAPDRGEGESPH